MVAARAVSHLVVFVILVSIPSATGGDHVPPYPLTQSPSAPEPPESLAIGGSDEEGMVVSWSPSPTPGIDTYRVYWATPEGWESMVVTNTSATVPTEADPAVNIVTVTALDGAHESRASEFAFSPLIDTMHGVPEYPYCDWLVVYVNPNSPPEPPVWVRYRLECLIPEP